jgi:hypothetical protein
MRIRKTNGVMTECLQCHAVTSYEGSIADKTTCRICGGKAEVKGSCKMVVKEPEECVNDLILKQWELFGKMLNEQTEYITGEVLRRLQSERNND